MNTYIISVETKHVEYYTIQADSLEEAKLIAIESDRGTPGAEDWDSDVRCIRFIPGKIQNRIKV